MGDRIMLVALFVAIGIVVYREVPQNFPPRPSVFVGVALIYSILAIVALASPGLAAAFAVAFDIGLLIRGGTPKPVNLTVLPGLGGTAAQSPNYNPVRGRSSGVQAV